MDRKKFTEITIRLNEAGFKDRVRLGPQPGERDNLPYGYVALEERMYDSWIDKVDIMNNLGLLGMRVVGVGEQVVYFEDPAALPGQHHIPPGQVG